MDATTQPGVQSSGIDVPGSEAAFQQLVDQGLFNDVAPQYRHPGEEESWQADEANEEEDAPEQAQQQQEPEQQPKPDPKAEEKPEETKAETKEEGKEPEGKEYASLDEYLKDAKLEPESFMQLPVTVKVDGQERAVPLAELQKSYQLSSAAYNRMNELAQERTQFQGEQTQVRQALGTRIQQVEELFKVAEQQLLADFNGINWQQLEAENPGQAALLFQRYQARQGAIQQHLQQIQATRQQEAKSTAEAREKAFPGEWAKLLAVHPEMGDPAKGQEARGRIFAYAQQVGIPQDQVASLLSPKGSFFAAYVRTLLDAAAYAALKKQAPATVNRVRTAPQMAKPGTRQVRDPKQVATQQFEERWARSGFRDDEAGAAVFERFV